MKPATRRLLWIGAGVAAVAYAVGPGRRRAVARILERRRPDLDDAWFDLPADVQRRDIATHDGGSVRVLEVGRGRPLVLLHGVTLAAEVWAPIMHLAADRYRIIALDVRGHGASVVGDDGVGRVPAAHDLATVLVEEDLHDAIVVGHSMGGMILGRFCGDHPDVLRERVAGCVFMDTAVDQLIPPGIDLVAARAGRAILAREAGGALPPRVPEDLEVLMMRVAFGRRPAGRAVQVAARLSHELREDYRSKLWIDLFDTDNRDGLARITQPSTVIVGSRDALTPIWAARRIMDNLLDGTLVVLPGVGHQSMQEDPRAVVAALDDLDARIANPGAVGGAA